MSKRVRPGYYRQDINKTKWEVPERYRDLRQVGTGAYGTVWWVTGAWMDVYHWSVWGRTKSSTGQMVPHTQTEQKKSGRAAPNTRCFYFLIWWRQPRRHLGCSIPVAVCIFFWRTSLGWVILGECVRAPASLWRKNKQFSTQPLVSGVND